MTMSQIFMSYLTWVVFIFGLIAGSFFNVCIYRIPRNIFWKSSRSFCPHCDAPIPFWLNIPVLSYVFLRGRTHCCSKSIAGFYPLVEFLSGVLFVYIYWRYPFLDLREYPNMSVDVHELIRFSHALIFTCLLFICSVIDMQHMIIPDVLSLPMIAVSLFIPFLLPELHFQDVLFGILLGGGGVYAVAWIYYGIRRREGIGMGDAKLLAAIGGWLGYQSLLPTVLIGSVTGSILGLAVMLRKRGNMQIEIPFGPFLAFGAAFYLLSPMHWMECLSKIHQFFASL